MAPAADVAYADSSLIVSLLAGPTHSTYLEAIEVFRRVAEGTLRLIVMPVIVAELTFALPRALRWSRTETAVRLLQLLDADGLTVREADAVRAAMALWSRRSRMSFPDAWLAASAMQDGPPVVASFDCDFDGIEGLRRISA